MQGGDHKLTMENFNFCFANFLVSIANNILLQYHLAKDKLSTTCCFPPVFYQLGRSIYGPGKYIFGCFDNSDIDETYQVTNLTQNENK